MKKNFLSFLLSFFITISFGQTTTNQKDSKDHFLKKAKSQRTVAWVLLGGGTGLFFGGGLTAFGKSGPTAWDYVFVTGLVADIVSIPFFISAHHNKKKAARVAFTNQKIILPGKKNIGWLTQASVTIKIGF